MSPSEHELERMFNDITHFLSRKRNRRLTMCAMTGCLGTAIAIAEVLGLDADEEWRKMRAKISAEVGS